VTRYPWAIRRAPPGQRGPARGHRGAFAFPDGPVCCPPAPLRRSIPAPHPPAQSLQRDYAAVKAGVTGPWSTSPVEGHMNRLKMLKRQIFGRARLDLLSRRFLLAPRERQGQAVDRRAPAQIHVVAA
jgi:hypothetical protein